MDAGVRDESEAFPRKGRGVRARATLARERAWEVGRTPTALQLRFAFSSVTPATFPLRTTRFERDACDLPAEDDAIESDARGPESERRNPPREG
jgi:hypothetical protein